MAVLEPVTDPISPGHLHLPAQGSCSKFTMPKLSTIAGFSAVKDDVILLPTRDHHHHPPAGHTPL